jgi:DMSO/TMAO reductase YedYZ molybdopterin-dependent catalytic subunit
MGRSRVTALRAAAAGTLAAAAALATGELLAGLAAGAPSLVLAVADVVIADTPGSVVRWSIATFGSGQKPLLVVGIVAATLAAGALSGLAARWRQVWGIAGLALLGVLGGAAAARATSTSAAWGWVVAGASSAVGIGVLLLLLSPARSQADRTAPTEPIGNGAERRRFLALAGATVLITAAGASVGRWRRESRNVEDARRRVAARLSGGDPALPGDVRVLDGQVAGLSPIVTPLADFYRIDTRILPPQVDPDAWSLRVTGLVEHEVEVTFDELLEMDRITEFVTLQCVSNEVGGDLVGNAQWSGVPLAALLERARPRPEASQIVGRAVDGWTAGFPLELAQDGRPSMVAVAMNGEPLPVRHGFPARLIVPGLYGYVSATKWLAEIELTTWTGFDGYWIPRGWAKEGPIKTQSRIDVPRGGAHLPAGRTAVAGVAWAPTRGIRVVEVRVDDGAWQPARLSSELSSYAWVQWIVSWDATPGRHRLEVRAVDGNGEAQTADVAPPAPSGATGYHTIDVEVR